MLGLYNLAISAPQILSAGITSLAMSASIAFSDWNEYGVVLRIGSVSLLAAAYLAFRVRHSLGRHEDGEEMVHVLTDVEEF